MTLPSPSTPRGTTPQWPTAVPGPFTALSALPRPLWPLFPPPPLVFPGITSTLSHLPHFPDSGPASGGPAQGCLSSSVRVGEK